MLCIHDSLEHPVSPCHTVTWSLDCDFHEWSFQPLKIYQFAVEIIVTVTVVIFTSWLFFIRGIDSTDKSEKKEDMERQRGK
jgi:hypothetical protein